MHDLPAQALLQQLQARPVSGEELEVMGKKAASRYLCGDCNTLNDAVVETVKQAGLSPEQVKRVIEFANTNAYIECFNKLGSDHKYVEFHGGPADPSVILKDLNDGGGGTVLDRGLADYGRLPLEKSSSDLLAQNRARMGLEKTAATRLKKEVLQQFAKTKDWGAAAKSLVEGRGGKWVPGGAKALGAGMEVSYPRGAQGAVGGLVQKLVREGKTATASVDFNPAETAFEQMWQSEDKPLPYAEPFQDIIEMHDKLADTKQQLASEMSSLEVDYMDVGDKLYGAVKQAAMDGTPLGHIIQAWGEVVPGPDYIKVAFGIIGPRLAEERVMSRDDMGKSMMKTAGSQAVVDTSHPLIGVFSDFCDTLTKLAATREVYGEVCDAHEKANYFLTRGLTKVAADDMVGEAAGLVPKAWRGAKAISASAAEPASRVTGALANVLFGPSAGASVQKGTKMLVEHAPHIAVALGAKEIYDRMRYTPAFQAAKNFILSRAVPYSQPWMVRQYNLQNQMI